MSVQRRRVISAAPAPMHEWGSGLVARGLRSPLVGPFDLHARRGTCVVISGLSGSGKSLLLRMIADLDPHQGEAWLDGVSRIAMPAPLWRRRVTYVPAEPGWWSDHVADHFTDIDALRTTLPALGLGPSIVDAPVMHLSSGERQRLALLRALQHDPAVLLLDEPCSALDAETTLKVEALLLQVMRFGKTLVLVSHDEAQAQRLADARVRLADGVLTRSAS